MALYINEVLVGLLLIVIAYKTQFDVLPSVTHPDKKSGNEIATNQPLATDNSIPIFEKSQISCEHSRC